MKMTLVWVSLAIAALSGCAVPKFLVGDGFIGPRGEKTILIPVGGDQKQGVLYNYVIRVCDMDNSGTESNCRDTTVLANVVPQSIY